MIGDHIPQSEHDKHAVEAKKLNEQIQAAGFPSHHATHQRQYHATMALYELLREEKNA